MAILGREPAANRLPRIGRVLRSKAVADGSARAGLELVKALDERQLFRLARRVGSSEAMHVLQLLKKQNGVFDAVDAKLQRIDILPPHLDSRFLTGAESLNAGKGEVGLIAILRRGGQQREQQQRGQQRA